MVVLKGLIFDNFHFVMCGGPESTDLKSFLLYEDVVLKILILDNSYFERV